MLRLLALVPFTGAHCAPVNFTYGSSTARHVLPNQALRIVRRIFEKRVCQDYWNQREYGLQLLCEDLYVRDDNTCFVLSLKNGGGVSYEAGDAIFVIESRKKGKRNIQYERNLYPKERSGSLSAAPGSTSRILYRFDKVTLTKDQVLKVYVYETGGQRHLVLTVNHYDINRARRS